MGVAEVQGARLGFGAQGQEDTPSICQQGLHAGRRRQDGPGVHHSGVQLADSLHRGARRMHQGRVRPRQPQVRASPHPPPPHRPWCRLTRPRQHSSPWGRAWHGWAGLSQNGGAVVCDLLPPSFLLPLHRLRATYGLSCCSCPLSPLSFTDTSIILHLLP